MRHTVWISADYNLTKGYGENPKLSMTLVTELAGDYHEGKVVTLNDIAYLLSNRMVNEQHGTVEFKLEEKPQ